MFSIIWPSLIDKILFPIYLVTVFSHCIFQQYLENFPNEAPEIISCDILGTFPRIFQELSTSIFMSPSPWTSRHKMYYRVYHDPIKSKLIHQQVWLYTAWKMFEYGFFFGPYFPIFGQNTEVFPVSFRSQFKHGKIRPRKKLHVWTFFTQGEFYKQFLCVWQSCNPTIYISLYTIVQ